MPYAISSTDIGYAPAYQVAHRSTRSATLSAYAHAMRCQLSDVGYWHSVCSYAILGTGTAYAAMRCRVLKWPMALAEGEREGGRERAFCAGEAEAKAGQLLSAYVFLCCTLYCVLFSTNIRNSSIVDGFQHALPTPGPVLTYRMVIGQAVSNTAIAYDHMTFPWVCLYPEWY
eukprot:3137471-Rhodomonas_salina.2